jgi:hypothetical protein
VPSVVVKATLTGWPLGADNVAVKTSSTVELSPSATPGSSIDNAGAASSSTIVPMPCPSTIVAFVAADRFTAKVSFGSSSVSSLICTVTLLLTSDGANVRTPLLDR